MSFLFGAAAQSIMSRAGVVGDPFYDDVQFYVNAYHGNASRAMQDWGPKRRTLMRYQSATRLLQSTQVKDNPQAFDDANSAANGGGLGFQFLTNHATTDFTIDGWVYCIGYKVGNTIDNTVPTLYGDYTTDGVEIGEVRVSTSGPVHFYAAVTDTGGANRVELRSLAAIPLNTWTHIALVRQGANVRLYVNGVLQASTAGKSTIVFGNEGIMLCVGNGSLASLSWNGYADALRFTSAARWSSDFTPATARYLPPNADGDEHFDSVVFLSNFHDLPTGSFGAAQTDAGKGGFFPTSGSLTIDRAVFKYGASSAYASSEFRGWQLAGDTAIARMTGQSFTAEAFVRSDGAWTGGTRGVLAVYTTTGNQRQWMLGVTDGKLRGLLSSNGSGFSVIVDAATLATNTWLHVAMDYNNSTGDYWIYVDGVQVATGNHAGGLFTTTSNFFVHGWNAAGTNAFVGWSSHHRVTRGVARYQGVTFTPPTAPYPQYKKV